jgi:regulatory protein
MENNDRRLAYRWAVRALSRRMRSISEVRIGLAKKFHPEEIISSVIDELVDKGFLDDDQFAHQWVTGRASSRYYGRLRISYELKRKGIPERTAIKALDLHLSPEKEAEIALRAMNKRMQTLRNPGIRGKAALYRHLEARGFTPQAIWAALSTYVPEEEKV